MRSSFGSYLREPTGAASTSVGVGRTAWLPSTLPLPAEGAQRLRIALAFMATGTAAAARCAARLQALRAIRPPRPDYDGDADACRILRGDAARARDAAREVLHDVVYACRKADLPPERVIRLVRELTGTTVRTCPDLPYDLAIEIDAEVVQWTIAAYYRPD